MGREWSVKLECVGRESVQVWGKSVSGVGRKWIGERVECYGRDLSM